MSEKPAIFPWMLPFNAQIRDVIYDYIDYIKGVEDVVIDSWPLQRLRYIYQLQMAHFVYPSATHTRFSHSLGVMHASYKYATYVLKGSLAHLTRSKYFQELGQRAREVALAARLLGLLHDVGHGPFSHAFDEYVYKTRDFLPYRVGNHEVVGYLIYKNFLRDVIGGALRDSEKTLGVDREYVVEILDEGMKPPPGMRGFTDLLSRGALAGGDFFAPRPEAGVATAVRLMVRDYIYTSDIIDYLRRDSYFTGLAIGEINDEWLLRHTFLVDYNGVLVPAISTKAVDDLVRLLEARKLMYKNVYFHHVNIAFVETVGRLLSCVKSKISTVLSDMLERGDYEKYAALTDFRIYGMLQELASAGPGDLECEDRDFAKRALESIFVVRKPLWKLLDRVSVDLDKAAALFSPRFGPDLRNKLREEVSSELGAAFPELEVSESDVLVLVNRVDVYPSAGSEVLKSILLASLKDQRVISVREVDMDAFAKSHGLVSEALISIYLERGKYKRLTEEQLARAREIVGAVISDLVTGAGAKREAPETS